ncbi:MAG TPA: diguanylate cyclase [Nannocystis sp.]|jgi:diguanylate cyclase (GGDEF)-like protein
MDSTLAAAPGEAGEHFSDLAVGATIGRYVIRERLGQGAMGVVYLANDPDLGREVALKMLKSSGLRDERVARVRLLREAQSLARISQHNVVGVHDVGISDGTVFIAMELVHGVTLTQWLKHQPRRWSEIIDIFVSIGTGLAAAHQAGIVHRDFKPENVLVGHDDLPKVTDFGLAHAAEAATEAPPEAPPATAPLDALEVSLTATGMLVGTPAYMSPEQFLRHPTDARSDQFSFCVALWEALYGRHPFQNDTLAALAVSVTTGDIATPTDTRGVPQWVQDCVLRGLSVAPGDRWPTMLALLAALERRSSFDASRAPRDVRALRLEAILGITFVPGFWILDWFVIPHAVWISLTLRMLCLAYGVAILVLLAQRPRWVELHVHSLAVSFSLLVAWSIALMCFLHVGYESSYYAGINLLVICVGQLYLWPLPRALLFTLGVYCFYMLPLALGYINVTDPIAALSNQFFLVSTMTVTVIAQVHRRHVESSDFDAHIERGRLEQQVLTDALTGLYNRAQFLRASAEEMERSRRYGQPLCLLVVDVDRLQVINETLGSQAGDEVLISIAARIVAAVRRQDIVSRHGGTFAVLLVNSQAGAVTVIADRIRSSICAPPVPTSVGTCNVTAKIGFTEITVETDNILEAFAQAGAMLDAAKHGGAPIQSWSARTKSSAHSKLRDTDSEG